jgi:hypothetical protein
MMESTMERSEIINQLGYRLQDCRGNLCSHYADQVIATGKNTTPEDAFSAWLKWLAAEGGKPQTPLSIDGSPEFRAFQDRAAHAIREVARIGENAGIVGAIHEKKF